MKNYTKVGIYYNYKLKIKTIKYSDNNTACKLNFRLPKLTVAR